MNRHSAMILTLISLISFCNAYGFSEEFDLRTLDGKSSIQGQIDFPENCSRDSYKAALLVGGTGLYYRNMYLGLSGTKLDFIFKDLSEILTEKCVAVVRYDYRGVTCDLVDDATIEACLDQEVRKKVDGETLLQDIQLVYDYAKNHHRIDKKSIVVHAYSEGSINISRLIKRGKIKPRGLVFVGGVTESAASLLRWQFVGRSVDLAFAFDANGDGLLTNFEIISGYKGSFFDENEIPLLFLMSPTGIWNRFTLKQFFNNQYMMIAKGTLATPSHFPYRHKDLIYSSVGWWQTWFSDTEPVVKKLANYRGKITYFNGTQDSQAPGKRQLNFLKNYTPRMKSMPEFNLIEGKGHLLSDHPEFGPLDLDQKEKVINAILKSF
ncbi:MAG: hypothetical protein K9K67_13290 [Bacteriovoracaceae bacterium]|nr:hypothetical protein [Bacteriovoracaceae bacterium]